MEQEKKDLEEGMGVQVIPTHLGPKVLVGDLAVPPDPLPDREVETKVVGADLLERKQDQQNAGAYPSEGPGLKYSGFEAGGWLNGHIFCIYIKAKVVEGLKTLIFSGPRGSDFFRPRNKAFLEKK